MRASCTADNAVRHRGDAPLRAPAPYCCRVHRLLFATDGDGALISNPRHRAEGALTPGSLVFAAVLALNGPFFPAALVQPQPRADTRRCSIGANVSQSDCALIGAEWVVTTAATVASARPVAGRLHVRIGDGDYGVEQLIYHPKWNGGSKYDVTLIKLAARVPSFPLLPPPGEYPANVERVAQRALPHREWVVQTIGASPLWDTRDAPVFAVKQAPLLTRVRSLMDSWAGRTSND